MDFFCSLLNCSANGYDARKNMYSDIPFPNSSGRAYSNEDESIQKIIFSYIERDLSL